MSATTLPPLVRSKRTNRANRFLLLLFGLILLLGGLAALLTGLGVFGSARADQPVFAAELVDFADRNARHADPFAVDRRLLLDTFGNPSGRLKCGVRQRTG